MKKVKLTETQKRKVAEFISEQLHTLKTEKRIGRMYYNDSDEVFIKSLDEAIRVGIAEEIWNR